MEHTSNTEPESDKSTILIKKTTIKRLIDYKRGNDTYDDVINRHADHFDKSEQ